MDCTQTTNGRASPPAAFSESQNIPQQATEKVGPSGSSSSTTAGGKGKNGKSAGNLNLESVSGSPSCAPEVTPARDRGAAEAVVPRPVQKEGKKHQQQPEGRQQGVEGDECPRVTASPAVATGRLESTIAADSEAESLALARQLLEEEAMASYAAAVGMFREGALGAGGAGVGPMEGVAAEDMAAMQALLEEDENSQDGYFMSEDDSLDYDGMVELGNAIGDVRKERWRLRCKAVLSALPCFRYPAGGDGSAGDDTKCLVCQCDFEAGEELRGLPCRHAFHKECVDGWLEENKECPTCRHSVDTQERKA